MTKLYVLSAEAEKKHIFTNNLFKFFVKVAISKFVMTIYFTELSKRKKNVCFHEYFNKRCFYVF